MSRESQLQLKPGVDNYAVFGNPIAHSRSPQIHGLFAEKCQQSIYYQAVLVQSGEFETALEGFKQAGGKGLNITLPFKSDAWQASESLSMRAREAGAVNTIYFDAEGRVHGDNTDGAGLVHDLRARGVEIDSRRILLLGAGGAARGVLGPLLDENAGQVMIANRTVSRAEELAALFSDRGKIRACAYAELPLEPVDIIINATSAGHQGSLPPLDPVLLNNSFCYDMLYGEGARPFLEWASNNGARAATDGLGMLVYQAAESFLIWRGVRPDAEAVISKLRSQ